MDARTPKPKWEDNRADELMALVEQLKRNARQKILAALVFGLLVGFMAGVYYEHQQGDVTFIYKQSEE